MDHATKDGYAQRVGRYKWDWFLLWFAVLAAYFSTITLYLLQWRVALAHSLAVAFSSIVLRLCYQTTISITS